MRMILCAIGAILVPAGSLAAQNPVRAEGSRLTLAEARAMAQRSSPELAAARQAFAAAQGRLRQAGAVPNPVLSYSREQTARAGETASQNIVSLEQRLELGGQRGARRRVAVLQAAAAEARLHGVAAQVDYEVAESYAKAVAAERRASLGEIAAAAFVEAQRVSRARLAGGDVSGYENRRLQLEAARYSAVRLAAIVARDTAVRALGSLIGPAESTDQVRPPQLVDTLMPAPLALDEDSLVARALTSRHDLRAAQLEAEAGLAEIRRVGAERIPSPALSGGFKNERLTTGESLNGFVLGVILPLPLWDRRGGALDATRADAASSRAQVDYLRRQAVREVRAAYRAHRSIADQLAALQKQLGDQAAKAREAATVAYREGEISLLEWLDTIRAYHEAESAFADLQSEYITRRAALERATGAPLF